MKSGAPSNRKKNDREYRKCVGMYRSSIQLFTQERVEAMGVRDLDNQQPALTGMGVSDPGMVSDGHVSFICRDRIVWVCDT